MKRIENTISIIKKIHKQRKDAEKIYLEQGRKDLAKDEAVEAVSEAAEKTADAVEEAADEAAAVIDSVKADVKEAAH